MTLPAVGSLAGVVNDDGVNTGTALAIQWSQTSGPGVATFADPSAPGSNVSFSATGTYVLTLTANDGEFSTSDAVTVVVNGVAPTLNTALQLGGTNAYATFGPAPAARRLDVHARRRGSGATARAWRPSPAPAASRRFRSSPRGWRKSRAAPST